MKLVGPLNMGNVKVYVLASVLLKLPILSIGNMESLALSWHP